MIKNEDATRYIEEFLTTRSTFFRDGDALGLNPDDSKITRSSGKGSIAWASALHALDDLSRREFQLIALCLLVGCGALDLSMKYLTPSSQTIAGGCDGASNCYVRSGAKGSENGADWTNAYTSLPSNLMRGVTYFVAAGTYPGHLFADPDDGTAYITVQAATSSKHGTSTGWSGNFVGQAVFNTADASRAGDIFTFQSDYYIVDGAYRSASTGRTQIDWSNESGYGFSLDNKGKVACNADIDLGDNSKTVPNPVHHILLQFVNVNGSHETASNGCRENGFAAMWGSHDYTLQYSFIHNTGLTILFLRGEHANCNGPSGNVTCGSPSNGYGNGGNINVKNNYFYENLSDPKHHAEGCSCSEGLRNLTIANNYWQDISGTGIIATASGAGWNNGNGGNGPWYIFGNVAFESSCSVYSGAANAGVAGFLYKWDTTFIDAVHVFNNTLYNFAGDCNSGSGVQLDNGTSPSPARAFYVEDNLWASSAQVQVDNTCPSSGGQYMPEFRGLSLLYLHILGIQFLLRERGSRRRRGFGSECRGVNFPGAVSRYQRLRLPVGI